MTRSLFRSFLILILGLAGVAAAKADFPTLALEVISNGELTAPVSMSHAGDGSGRLFICDQKGKVRIIQNGMLLPTPFLDLTAKVVALTPAYDERGLLGLAFHPNYSAAGQPGFGKFYVFYSAVSPNAPGTPQNPVNCRTTISEFQVSADPNVANAATERILLTFDKPQLNHNGGELVFGPDGYLYISAGDGGGADDNGPGHTGGAGGNPPPNGGLGNAQDLTRYMGKLLRIDPLGNNGPNGQYGIPADNYFVVHPTSGALTEIFAYGLRNPWRASFDDGPGGSNRLFLADVGQNKIEEVNIITNGGNYGWRHVEGVFDHDPTSPVSGLPLLDPIAQYLHPGIDPSTLSPVPAIPPPTLGRSICGGFLYRGSAIPAMQGKYIFGDYDSNAFTGLPAAAMVIGIEETSPGVWSVPALVNLVGGNPLSTHMLAMGRDEFGEIYLLLQGATGPQNDPNTGLPTGGIFKIVTGSGGSAPALTRRETWLQQYFLPGHFVSDTADLDSDGISNLLEYAFAFSPLAANPPGSGFQTSVASIGGGNNTFTVTFRRDPRATDLTYTLQTSSDLVNWTTIAQSVAGAVPTGSGFVSEIDAVGESPVKVVTAQENITAAQGQRFARLQVTH
jgi:glucose/arabinose dehydrogenase